MLDKRFPEYWANQACLDIIWQFYWIEKVFQPPDEVRDFNYHKNEAKGFRKYMRDNMKTETCGVCARRTRWNEFHYEDEEWGNNRFWIHPPHKLERNTSLESTDGRRCH